MLKHRIMTGVAVCVVCFGILFFLPAWTHLFLLLAVFALAQVEWAEMVRGSGHRYEFWATTLCGGAFLLVYLVAALLVGTPLMVAEFIIGRRAKASPVGAFRRLSGGSKGWPAVG